MSNRRPVEVFPPGEFIREEIDERGWTQSDLAKIMGRPVSVINLIIAGKRGVTAETAKELSGAFGTSPEFWLNLENAYKLSKVSVAEEVIRQRAKLYEIAPVKELENRNWIRPSESPSELESELKSFFETDALDNIWDLKVAARASAQSGSPLTIEQRAWCFRARQLAKEVPAEKYTQESFEDSIQKLRTLAAFPEEARKVPRVLSEMGIRFVVVEHLSKTKIDGAAFWLDRDKPVIALSLRHDRIDGFWHTLFHELSHIKHKDSSPVDVDIVGEGSASGNVLTGIEERANREAAEWLIPEAKLKSFVVRVKPFYSKQRIIQFANTIKIHPGVVAGQLQYLGEIKWNANREMLVKVRDIIVSEARTDGWGASPKGL